MNQYSYDQKRDMLFFLINNLAYHPAKFSLNEQQLPSKAGTTTGRELVQRIIAELLEPAGRLSLSILLS
jgi:hypothetical protein